jgi:hypothetical protein
MGNILRGGLSSWDREDDKNVEKDAFQPSDIFVGSVRGFVEVRQNA